KLDALTGTGVAAQREQLQSQLVAAQERLKSDAAKLDQVLAGPQQEEIDAAAAAVRQAEQQLALAVVPSTEDDIRAQRALVDQARQQLEKARLPAAPADIQQQRETVAEREAVLQSKANPFTVNDLNAAQAAVDQARSQVAVAQGTLDQTIVVAPFDGVISQRLLAPGSFATTTTPIVALVGADIETHVTVEEARLASFAPGQTVALEVPAYPGVLFPGRVTAVSPTGDTRAHTFDVTIVPTGSDQRLRPGMFAQVDLTVSEKDEAVLVPREAVVQQDGRSVVFVVQDGRARARPVETGISSDQGIEIVSGVTPGDRVVVVGQQGLRDGSAVRLPEAQTQGEGQRPQGQRRQQ
ncbi:MAG TPA: efflux RND transporter periplasmic adaptor subunit, partial [Nocardioidaceae bacterium]